ncbi:MAG: hypothetical protein NVS9B10_29110 [Nevskia sp.]
MLAPRPPFPLIMPSLSFTLEAEYIEVNQLLKLAGVCDSGGAGKALVAEGRVRVDGQAETRKTAKIRAGQTVACNGLSIAVVAGSPASGASPKS